MGFNSVFKGLNNWVGIEILAHALWKTWVLFNRETKFRQERQWMENKTETMQHVLKI